MRIPSLFTLFASLLLTPACVHAQSTDMAADVGEPSAVEPAATVLDGKRFTVLVEGEGTDVILIPGLASPREVWDATRQQLSGKYKVHIVQIRGFGDTPGLNVEGPVLKAFIRELADYIDDEIIPGGKGEKPFVIGHSLGGFTAMQLAAKYPGLVKRAMVVDSLPFFGMIFGAGATTETMQPQAAMLRDMIAAREEYTADARTLQTMSITEEGRALVAAWAADADPKAVAHFMYDLMTTDMRGDMPGITVPVTMLYPLDESVMPAARVDAVYKAAFAGADSVTLKRIDDSRHFIMLDRPETFAKAVEDFLTEK
ncbi:alpha/beta hydrolase [Sphingorhabdus sp. Alg239-R122]|uniref:alpha/beta fold hydrolase n=1 Tax=Sphingorhabdus sp. Alg239-R122 TaxID=2305989 RepID=UPI0013DC5B71|nr:alpha/beta hydrolase [Sphingorhabdus sp. Alg239-R122]